LPKKEKEAPGKRNTILSRFLSAIERIGNALPHPATLFAIFAFGLILFSWLSSKLGLAAVNPRDGVAVLPINLISRDGLHWILENTIVNFTGFAPLGTVLVAMLGIGVAEKSGLISTSLRLMVHAAPKRLLTFVIVFAGVMSNLASDVGYVLLVPMGAIIFLSVGRHPEEAARIIDPQYTVTPACNYYFMVVSTFLIAAVGTWVTETLVEPRLGSYEGGVVAEGEELRGLTAAEKLVSLLLLVLVLIGLVPENGILRDAETGSVLHSPFMHGIVAFIFLGGLLAGLAYGIATGTFRSDADVVNGMKESMESLGIYMVLVFFAAQFVAYFKYTNLGIIFAIKGAEVLKASGLGPIPLMLCFVLLAAVINLCVGSASAQWAFMAPVFIPMFMLLGYQPLRGQRVGPVGLHGAGVHPHVHVVGVLAGAGAGRFPHRRQLDQPHLSDDVFLRFDRGLCTAVRPEGRYRNGDRHDAPLLGGIPGGVDGAVGGLDAARSAAWTGRRTLSDSINSGYRLCFFVPVPVPVPDFDLVSARIP